MKVTGTPSNNFFQSRVFGVTSATKDQVTPTANKLQSSIIILVSFSALFTFLTISCAVEKTEEMIEKEAYMMNFLKVKKWEADMDFVQPKPSKNFNEKYQKI